MKKKFGSFVRLFLSYFPLLRLSIVFSLLFFSSGSHYKIVSDIVTCYWFYDLLYRVIKSVTNIISNGEHLPVPLGNANEVIFVDIFRWSVFFYFITTTRISGPY